MLPDLLPVPPIVARVKPLANERNIVGHCMLLRVVRSCFAKFETDQTFEPTTPNISFVPWSPKRSAIMLDLFAQLFQHCWGPHSLQSLMGCILPTVHYRSQYCWELLHPFAHRCQHGRKSKRFKECNALAKPAISGFARSEYSYRKHTSDYSFLLIILRFSLTFHFLSNLKHCRV